MDTTSAIEEQSGALARLGRSLYEEVAQQKARLFLWLPFFIALGIGAYFTLPVEPPFILGLMGFLITAEQVTNKQFGILVYAHEPRFLPFFGGTLCLGAGLRRVGAVPTNGNSGPLDCSGTLSYDFNTWIASGKDPALVDGFTAYAQWWFREPGDILGVGLTDALQFTIGQ